MEIEVIKKLIKQYTAGHVDFIRQAETAQRYYENEPDLLREPSRREKQEKEHESETPLRTADNRIPFNFHGLLVNQKAAYMFTAPPLFDLGSREANKVLQAFLGDKYQKACKDLCIEASNASVGWLHVWKDRQNGQYRYAVVPSCQVMPIWNRSLEKELQGVLRRYHDTTEDGKELDVYEYWNDTVCEAYAVEAGNPVETGLVPFQTFTVIDERHNSQLSNTFPHGIGEVPFFAFANNNTGFSDLKNIKPLIDAYCKVFSGFVNDLEDIQEVIFILTNYGGANLTEFLSDLKFYKAIKVDNDGAGDSSGVSTLTIDLPVEAREKLLAITRKCIFEQGMGIDPDPQNFGNSSGVALNFLYSLLDLKAGLMETEFRPSFGRFIRCICRLLGLTIKDDVIQQTWTRTSVRNDQETASIAAQSKGVISDETIVKNHPWVDDMEEEMERLKAQEEIQIQKAEEYRDAFSAKGKEGGVDVDGDEE